MELNLDQRKIVDDHSGFISVVAGPGSGKTRVLVERVFELVKEGVDPRSILLISFTNKVCAEIKYRLRIRNFKLELVQVHTFHSFGVKILRENGIYVGVNRNFNVIDDQDAKQILNEVYKIHDINKKDYPIAKVFPKIYNMKRTLEMPQELIGETIYHTIFNYYTYYKRQNGYLDFEDILVFAEGLLKTEAGSIYATKIQYLMVDEAQDLNKIQYSFVNLLIDKGLKNVLLVGDFDQNIYSWRGATPRLFKDFYAKSKKYELGINYRSTPEIVECAKNLIENNPDRIKLNLRTYNESHVKPHFQMFSSQHEQVDWVTNKIKNLIQSGVIPQEIAILYRSNYLSREYEASLIIKNIPYTIYNGFEFYGRREIKDVISLLKIIYNPSDEVAWIRVLLNLESVGEKTIDKIQKLPGENLAQKLIFLKNENPSSISKTIKEKINNLLTHIQIAQDKKLIFEKVTYLVDTLEYFKIWDDGNLEDRIENYQELLRSIEAFDKENLKLEDFLENVFLLSKHDEVFGIKDKIKLMTMHSSKGLEFEHVFIVNAVDGVIPSSRSLEEGDLEEERRLMYVAMTRPRRDLYISYSPVFNFHDYFGNISRFIYESKIID